MLGRGRDREGARKKEGGGREGGREGEKVSKKERGSAQRAKIQDFDFICRSSSVVNQGDIGGKAK